MRNRPDVAGRPYRRVLKRTNSEDSREDIVMFHDLTYAAQAERAADLRREADYERLLRSARRPRARRKPSGRRWLRAISGAQKRTARPA